MNPVLLLSFLPLLTCCQITRPVADTAVYHLLDPLVPERIPSASAPSIAVKRPSLPGYLDRQQLVTRTQGQLLISQHDLWAEPLKSALSRVIALNLSRLTGSLVIQPVENFTTLDDSKLLELRIARFEPTDAGPMIFEGTWKLQPLTGAEASSTFFSIPVTIGKSSSATADRVTAMNRALELLSRQIAKSL